MKRRTTTGVTDINHSALRQHISYDGTAKKSFTDRAEAEAHAIKRQSQAGASKRRPYRVYECEMCGKFHVGKRKPK